MVEEIKYLVELFGQPWLEMLKCMTDDISKDLPGKFMNEEQQQTGPPHWNDKDIECAKLEIQCLETLVKILFNFMCVDIIEWFYDTMRFWMPLLCTLLKCDDCHNVFNTGQELPGFINFFFFVCVVIFLWHFFGLFRCLYTVKIHAHTRTQT